MRTDTGLLVVALVSLVILSAGNAAAFGEPVFGTLDTTAASGDIVVLWVEDDRTTNPDRNRTTMIGDPYLGLAGDQYYFMDIEPLLKAHGKDIGDLFTITVALLCDDPDTNTYHNDTGVTQTETYGIAGATVMPEISLSLCAAEETFSKPLSAGWNLISLPLTPLNNSTSDVIGASCDAAYRYDAESNEFESVLDATMDPGTGYFVHATADCTWEYSGTTAYITMDVPLEQGLNMVGWLNCSKGIKDALSSVSGDYHYIARWNASAEKFEVYNPAAPDPSVFNDFTRMGRGTGYFISAKQDCTLNAGC